MTGGAPPAETGLGLFFFGLRGHPHIVGGYRFEEFIFDGAEVFLEGFIAFE